MNHLPTHNDNTARTKSAGARHGGRAPSSQQPRRAIARKRGAPVCEPGILSPLITSPAKPGFASASPDDAYVRELLATIALQHAPIVSGQREVGALYAKLLHWVEKYQVFPSAFMVRRIALHLAIDLLRTETRQRFNADGSARSGAGHGVTFVSLDAPADPADPYGATVAEILSAPDANTVDPRERWELDAATLIAAALPGERSLRPGGPTARRDRDIVDRVLVRDELMAVVGCAYGLTRSRVSQIVSKARARLRRYLDTAELPQRVTPHRHAA